MSKRIVKFDEDDLKVIFEGYMEHAGFKTEEQEIVGFAYGFRRIKKGGDFYKDVVDKDGPDVERVKWIKVLMVEKGRKKEPEEDLDETTSDESSSSSSPSPLSSSATSPALAMASTPSEPAVPSATSSAEISAIVP